jgi:hypothetical protein
MRGARIVRHVARDGFLLVTGGAWWLRRRRTDIGREARRLALAGLTRPGPEMAPAIDAVASSASHLCPVCRRAVDRFQPSGQPGSAGWRDAARCPECGALERHRVGWLYLVNETDLYDGYERKAVLHLSSDRVVLDKLLEIRRPARLLHLPDPPDGAEAIVDRLAAEPDASFDFIHVCHGLERVPDDGRALAELHRLLAPGGVAVFQTSPFRDQTVERDPAATPGTAGSPLRVYGRDFAQRLEQAGFSVAADDYRDRLSEARRRRYGRRAEEAILRCAR